MDDRTRKHRAFRGQMAQAIRRGIAWQFEFDDWCRWWGDDFCKRGHGHGLCMARRGDVGPYNLANVYKTTSARNLLDARAQPGFEARQSQRLKDSFSARRASGMVWHLDARGDGHPKSKAVMTPAGRFGSCSLAAEHYGITRAGMALRCKRDGSGFSYL